MPTMHQKAQEFIGAGNYTFTVPAGVHGVFVTMIGGGGSGGNSYQFSNGAAGNGGGAGELVVRFPVPVTPGDVIPVVVGAGAPQNTSLWPTDYNGKSGFPTSFGSVVALGARGGDASSFGGGVGGGGGGGPGTTVGGFPRLETPVHIGGGGISRGGPLRGPTSATGATGVGSGGLLWGGLGGAWYQTWSGGGGGAGTIWGPGGAGGRGRGIGGSSHGAGGNTGGHPPETNGLPAPSTSYGAGGGGAGGTEASYSSKCIWGGAGAPGYCLVEWYEEDP